VNLPSGQLGDTATGTGTAEGWTFPTPEVTVTSGAAVWTALPSVWWHRRATGLT